VRGVKVPAASPPPHATSVQASTTDTSATLADLHKVAALTPGHSILRARCRIKTNRRREQDTVSR
jgi:hypothetical protein